MPTKQEVKNHERAMKIIETGFLSDGRSAESRILDFIDDIDPFLIDPKNAKKDNAFFTPVEVAFRMNVFSNCDNMIVLDLCAGIGVLSKVHSIANEGNKYICIERNPLFVEIGKKILPEAQWICADVTRELIESLTFDVVISNPPFGGKFEGYKYPSEIAAVEICASADAGGVLIVPPNVGTTRYYNHNEGKQIVSYNTNVKKIIDEFSDNGLHLAVDTYDTIDSGVFTKTNIATEIVNIYVDRIPKEA